MEIEQCNHPDDVDCDCPFLCDCGLRHCDSTCPGSNGHSGRRHDPCPTCGHCNFGF